MIRLIHILPVLVPLSAALWIGVRSRSGERSIARIAGTTTVVSWLTFLGIVFMRGAGFLSREISLGSLYRSGSYSFDLSFTLDTKAQVLLGLSVFLVWIMVRFSQVYLHREEGFGRFFRTLFLAQSGIALLATAGNLDLLFVGWEWIGISSFLLIGFYRERVNPVWNAFRVYVIYRICDVGILLGAFLEHHGQEGVLQHPLGPWLLGLAVLLPAAGKSAQFPFSFWLPRALEGPTPSSAVFYGALSIHAGVFLLLRTSSHWMPFSGVRVAIFCVGLISLVVGTLIGRAQANIKGQIGYAAIAQVGVMFMEVALGLENLVLWHMVSHAILRTFQFLTSPSAVAHFIRFPVPDQKSSLFGWLNHAWIRRLSIGEFFLEEWFHRYLIHPLRILGRYAWIVFGMGVFGLLLHFEHAYQIMALALSWLGFSSRSSRWTFAWTLLSVVCIVIGGGTHADEMGPVLGLCLSGVIPGLLLWSSARPTLRFYGWLCLIGFPLTPFFIGEDLLLHEVSRGGLPGMLMFFVVFALNGIQFARCFVEDVWLPKTRGY